MLVKQVSLEMVQVVLISTNVRLELTTVNLRKLVRILLEASGVFVSRGITNRTVTIQNFDESQFLTSFNDFWQAPH